MSGVTCSSPSGPHAPGPEQAVAALEASGFEFGPPQPSTRSVLDTVDGRLHRAGARLDARPVYKPGSADAVELSPHGAALPDRPLVVGRMPSGPGDLPAGQFNLQLASIVQDHTLQVQFTMTSQCAHALRRNRDGKAVARVELHTDVQVVDGTGTTRDLGAATWCLELHELPEHPGQATKARRRLDEIGLDTIASDSLGWAAAMARIDLAGVVPAERVRLRLRSDDRAGRATRAVLRRLGDVVAASWQGASDGSDPESLHELRVALRRARAVLRASRDVVPEHAREEALDLVVSLARHTGAPRDLDVHLLEWTSYVAPLDPSDRALLEPVREVLAARRDTAHVSLQEAMDAAGRDRWHRRFDELIDTRRELDGDRPSEARRAVGKVIAKRIERAHRRLVARGRKITATSTSDAIHRLRKDAKQLRYLLDAFGSLASSSHRRTYLAELKTLQDRLGALQDATVHRSELDDVAGELLTAPQATFDALASMAEVLDARCTALRGELVDALDAFDGKATRRALRRVLDDLRD